LRWLEDAEEEMPKARDTATDRLSNVIEVVELGRRTGLLSAERGMGPSLEEGEIYFVSGRPIYAAVGQLRGREALATLGQWGACRFAFDITTPSPSPNLSGVLSPVEASGSQPGATPPRVAASGVGWRFPAGPPPSSPLPPAGQSTPGAASMPWGDDQRRSAPAGGPLGRRPRRSPDVRDLMAVVTTYNLSRSHRTILLLADGSHNVLDLARLASKSVDEVTQLLADLESRGLVYYYE
jgi:hypothetical protein